jgi:hypothetical protein
LQTFLEKFERDNGKLPSDEQVRRFNYHWYHDLQVGVVLYLKKLSLFIFIQSAKCIIALRQALKQRRGGLETFVHIQANKWRAARIEEIMQQAKARNANRNYGM